MRIDFRIAFPREPGITDTLVLSRDLWWPHIGAPWPGGHQISDLPHAAGAEALTLGLAGFATESGSPRGSKVGVSHRNIV